MLTICYSYTRTLLSKQWFWVTFLIFPEQFRGISDKNSSQLHNTTCLCGVNILKHRTTTHHTLRPSETNGETRPVKLGIRLVNVLSLKIASLQSITKPVTFSHKMYCASKRPLSEDHTLEQKAVLSMPRKGGSEWGSRIWRKLRRWPWLPSSRLCLPWKIARFDAPLPSSQFKNLSQSRDEILQRSLLQTSFF